MPTYYIDPLLMLSAQMHADYLASQEGYSTGHIGVGGTDATQRAYAVGYPQVEYLRINENWASLPADKDMNFLLFTAWGDTDHMHNILHWQGQHVGAGVASNGDQVFYILNIACYWGDPGLTQQPTTGAYPGLTAGDLSGLSVSQYIAPVKKAQPDEDGKIIHLIQQGQTLWSIATEYGVSIEQIRRLNGLSTESMIYMGQKLLVDMISTPVPSQDMRTSTPNSLSMTEQYKTRQSTAITTPTQKDSKENVIRGLFDDSNWALYGIFFVILIGFTLLVISQKYD
jgi:hypothetical protein